MYRANVSDKDQSDFENAANNSAIRIQQFNGTKFMRAYDAQAQGNTGSTVSSLRRQFSSNGLCMGSHNDKPATFETPGKA